MTTPAPDFLRLSGLPERWRERERFVVLDTAFGAGNRFLAVWNAWQTDPQRCGHLVFIALEPTPPTRAELAPTLAEAWPPMTPNLHRLSFDSGRVQLHLLPGAAGGSLRDCVAEVDAFLLDAGTLASLADTEAVRLLKSIARLAAADATLLAWADTQALRDGLASVGFAVSAPPGGKAGGGLMLARFAPRFERKRAPLRAPGRPLRERRALVVGAGLAGCAAAWALAERGWHTVVLDRHTRPAQEASGNPGGLFHGIVNPQDGMHARFNRAAALEAQRAVLHAIAHHGVAGSAGGLLRLNTASNEIGPMRATLRRLGLPSDYVQAVDAEQAGVMCGWTLRHPAWFYPGGGWVDPAGLARAYLERAAPWSRFVGGADVQTLQRNASAWQLCDAQGRVIDEAETVVLANAGDALRLLGAPAWPIEAVRGQISIASTTQTETLRPLPRLPLSGAGYLLPEVNGQAVFGSTTQAGDMDPAVRLGDHADNLARLALLRGAPVDLRADDLQGRTAWRWVSSDRLPVIGAVPEAMSMAADRSPGQRLDQPRFVPRQPGLFVFTALGSRGITWSALGAQVLASWVSGAPSPLEASLLDAIDPARFVSRAVRQRRAR